MQKHIQQCLIFLVVILFTTFAFAQTALQEQSVFDIEKANAQFNIISSKLSEKRDLTALTTNIKKLESLQSIANTCVNNAQTHLKIIDELLKATQISNLTAQEQADYQYLQDKKLMYAKQLSECRLFIYRSQESLITYKDQVQQLSTVEILSRSTPIWNIHENHFLQMAQNTDLRKIANESGMLIISTDEWMMGIVVLLLSLSLAIYCRYLCRRWLSQQHLTHPAMHALIAVFSMIVAPLFIFSILSLFFNGIYYNVLPVPTVELISHALLLFTVCFFLSRYFFYLPYIMNQVAESEAHLGKNLNNRFIILLSWLLIGYLAVIIFASQDFSHPLIEFARTLFITVLGGLIVWFGMTLCRIPFLEKLHHVAMVFIKIFLWLLLIAVVVIEWLGYHRLAGHLMTGVLMTVISIAAAMMCWRFVDIFYQWLDNKSYSLARKTHRFFGLKLSRKSNEIWLLKILANIVILCFFAMALMKSWAVSQNFIDTIQNGLLNGFNLAGLPIDPLQIGLALLSFAVIMLCGRALATHIAKKRRFTEGEDTQIAISTIIVYVTFAIALLIALVVTGINFTSLTIIAGALSVGVGLGLQSIVNNFVSGLILLIEKPIKPGDRIVIGTTEGFVKKIRIRSTQISTTSKEDVIVPNADLITHQVTNYMFRDHFSRVTCKIGVAYGSDTTLVKNILLEIATKNPEVVQEEPNAPLVLFRKFDESSLAFELWCVIHDVNKKYNVVSDLNFAIDAAFRENNISIAFPQQDVRIIDYRKP